MLDLADGTLGSINNKKQNQVQDQSPRSSVGALTPKNSTNEKEIDLVDAPPFENSVVMLRVRLVKNKEEDLITMDVDSSVQVTVSSGVHVNKSKAEDEDLIDMHDFAASFASKL